MTTGIRIIIEQLKDGQAWRKFTLHPSNEDDLAGRIARIERGYLMSATRVTIERPGQPDEVLGGPAPKPDEGLRERLVAAYGEAYIAFLESIQWMTH